MNFNRQEILKHHNAPLRQWSAEDIELFNYAETIGGFTVEKIAEYLEISHQRVTQIEQQALTNIALLNPFIVKVLKKDFCINNDINRKQIFLDSLAKYNEKKRKYKANRRELIKNAT
ncbi:MAG: hypothetical protein ACKO96_04940 [Flammeovirgaceae bacterium]